MGSVTFLIIISTALFSYNGFRNHRLFEKYLFEVDRVLINKEYIRLVSSGFLHVGWMHLIFNMFSLYAFSGLIELYLGGLKFLVIYFSSLIGGNLLALLIHKQHGDYSAVGASGAVNGIVFASIALFPGLGIRFFGIPINIPNWLYGILFVAFSIYAIRSKRDNIGHEAHLGGALIGMLVAIVMVPASLAENYLPILVILLPSVGFICLIMYRPEYLFVDNFFYNQNKSYKIDDRYNIEKVQRQMEIDRILDKIHQKGMNSLTAKEKRVLQDYSKTGK
jgi:membrane associated rhomboid family serine protease